MLSPSCSLRVPGHGKPLSSTSRNRYKVMESRGTYALLLHNHCRRKLKVGRWREIDFRKGYYIYIGSAFGPGGLKARVGRHFRRHKALRWHIDYLAEVADVTGAWLNRSGTRYEHDWAAVLQSTAPFSSIDGFGCSDCDCRSHLFFSATVPDRAELAKLLHGDIMYVSSTQIVG